MFKQQNTPKAESLIVMHVQYSNWKDFVINKKWHRVYPVSPKLFHLPGLFINRKHNTFHNEATVILIPSFPVQTLLQCKQLEMSCV